MAGDGEDISADLLWSTLGFSDPAVRREQADFLEHLSMQILLIDNIDHAIRRWKPQEFMNALSGVFMDLSAPDNILELSARAMTYFMDLNIDYKSALKPQTAKSIFARLKAADFSTPANKSMAEQCVKLLEKASTLPAMVKHSTPHRTTPHRTAHFITCLLFQLLEKASTLQAMMKHSRDWLALVTFLTRHHPQLHHDIIPSAMAVVMAFSHIMCDQIHVDICLEALEALLSVYHPVIWKESLNALFALLDNMSHHPYFVDQPKVVLTNHDLAPQLLGHLSTLVTVIANPASARGNVMGEMLLFEHERLQIADLLVQNLTALCQLSKVTVSQVLKSNFCHILNIALTKIHRNDKEGWPVTTVFLACRLLYATLIPWVRDKYLDPPYCFSYIPDRAVLEMYASRVIPAIKAQDDSFISEAVENGFSVDWADSKGQTLMNWAAAVGSSRIVSYLLDCGADKDKGLKTSLHYAVIFNRLYIVKCDNVLCVVAVQILLGNGAKVEVFDDTDQTVYDLVNRIAPHRKFDPHFILIQSCVESQVHLFGVHPSSPPRQHQGSFDPLVKQMPEIASSFVDQCLSIFTKTALTMTNTFIRKVALMQVHNIVSQVDAVFLRRLVAVSDVAATLALVLAQQLHSGEDKEHVLSTSLYMLDKVGKDFLSHFIRHGLHNKVAALITHRGDSTPAEVEELWELSQTREMKEGLIYLWEQWRVMRGRTHLYVWSNKIGFEFRLNNMWSYTFTKHRNAYLRGVSDDGRKVALMQVHNIVSQVDAVFLRRLVAVSDVAATLALVLAQQLHSGEDKEHVLSTSLYMLDKVGKDFLSHFIRHGLHNKVAALITHRGDSTPAEVEELWELSQTREMKEGLIYLWEQWRVMRGRTHLYVWSNKIGFEFRLNNMWSYTFTKHRNAYLRGVSDDGRSFQAWRKRIFPLLERRFQKEYASLGSEPSRKWLFSFPSIGCVVAGNWEFRSAKKDACVIIPRQRRHAVYLLSDRYNGVVSMWQAVYLLSDRYNGVVSVWQAVYLLSDRYNGVVSVWQAVYLLSDIYNGVVSVWQAVYLLSDIYNGVVYVWQAVYLLSDRYNGVVSVWQAVYLLSDIYNGVVSVWQAVYLLSDRYNGVVSVWQAVYLLSDIYNGVVSVWQAVYLLSDIYNGVVSVWQAVYLLSDIYNGVVSVWQAVYLLSDIYNGVVSVWQAVYLLSDIYNGVVSVWQAVYLLSDIYNGVVSVWQVMYLLSDIYNGVVSVWQAVYLLSDIYNGVVSVWQVVYLHMNGGMVVHSLIKNSVCELTNLSHSEGPLPFVDTLILTLPLLPADQPSQTSVLASFLCADHLGEVQSKSRAATAHLETVVQQLNFALTKQYRHKQSPEEGENWAEELQEALKALASLVKDELSISCYEIISSSLVPCLLSLLGSEGADSEMTKARVRFFEEAFQGKKGGATELTTKLVFALEVLEKMSCVTYDLNSQKLDTSTALYHCLCLSVPDQLLSAWVLMVLEKLPEEEGEEGEDLCDCSGLALRPQHVTPMRQIEDFVAKLAVRSWYNSPRHTMTWAKLMKDGLFNRDVFTLNHGDYRYGLLYWIATNGRTHEWVNPVRAGLIRTGTDTKFSKQFPDLFSLARPHWVPERQIERLVIYIDLLLHLMPTCYVMKVLPAHRQRWRLEGSADAKTWQSVMGTAEHSALGGKFTVNPILWNDDGPGLRYLCLTVMNRGPLPFSHFDIYGTVCSVCGDEQEVNGRGAGEGGGYAAEFPPLNQRPQKRLLSSSAPSGILRLSQNTDGFFLTYNNSSDKEEDRAANAMPTVVDWDAPWMPVGSPQWMPVGSPQGMPVGSPQGMPVGSPQGMPAEAPQGMPADAENAGIRGEPQAEDQGGDVDDENEEDDDKSEEGEDDENGDGDENEEGYEGDENEDDENKGYQDDENEQGEDADYEVHFEDYADEGEVGAEAYVSEQRLMLYWQSILGPEDLEPAEQPQHPAYSELDSRDAQSGIKYRAAVNDWILWNEATELVSDFPEIIPQSSDAQTEETVPLAVPLPEGTVARLAQPESAHPKLAFVLRATSYSKKDMKPLEVTVDDRKAVIFKYIHRLVEMAAAKNPSTGLVKLLEDMKFTLCYRKARPEDDGDQSEHIAKQFQDWKRMVNAGSAAGENRDCKVSDILQLLHKLHCLAHIYPFHDSHDDHHQPLHDAKVQLHIHASAFFSQKMAEKLIKQLEEVLLLCCDCLPEWFNLFINNFQILIPLKTRIHIFRATAFGTVRSIMWSAAKQRQHMPHTVLHQNQFASLRVMLADMPRQDEQRLLEMTMHLMNNVGHRQASLEVTFEGEVAVGLGPTKEFYTVLSAMLQWHSLGMWMCHDDHSAHTPTVVVGEGEQPAGKYVQWPSGLFPAPYPPHSAALPRVVTLFRFLGIVLARCLMDYHIIDLPLSEPFLAILAHATHQRPSGRLWFEGILSRLDFATVHPTMGQLVGRLHQLYERKRSILQSHTLTLEQKEQHLKDAAMLTCSCQLEDLDLAFEYLPSSRVYGFKSAELVVNGANKKLTVHNVEEYMDGLMSFALCYGIAHQLNALKEGFDSVFPMAKLRIFSPEELRGLLCGDQTPHWTLEVLTKHINPVSGFTAHSATFKMALQALSELSGAEVKLFLLFTTGCSCLPPGGLASLSPRIAIARKVGELDSYPSASICVHYLKLPDYSSLDVLRERLRTAIRVKGFAFT
ncbi:hypothetical protein ACOMHN_025839 [Nucella lapillus]